MLRLSTHKDAFSKTKYEAIIALKNIEDLSKKIKNKKNNFDQYLHIIKDFNKNPEIYQKSVSPKIPDGSPIGHFSCQ